MTNRPNNSERNDVQKNDAKRYQNENAAITLVRYNLNVRQPALRSATSVRATRNDRRTA